MAIIHPKEYYCTVSYSQKYYYIIAIYNNTYSAGMKERCRDGCRTSLLIAGVVLVPAVFHTLLPPCHPYITIHFMEMIFSTCLICVPLLQGIPAPQGLSLSNTETSAEMSGLCSGVTYNCNISAVTVEGSSQPKSLILTTPEIGMLTIMILPLFECVYTHQHKYLQFHLVHQRCLRQCQEREKWCSPGLLLPLLSKMDLSLVTLSSALPLSPLSLSLSHLSPDPLSQ